MHVSNIDGGFTYCCCSIAIIAAVSVVPIMPININTMPYDKYENKNENDNESLSSYDYIASIVRARMDICSCDGPNSRIQLLPWASCIIWKFRNTMHCIYIRIHVSTCGCLIVWIMNLEFVLLFYTSCICSTSASNRAEIGSPNSSAWNGDEWALESQWACDVPMLLNGGEGPGRWFRSPRICFNLKMVLSPNLRSLEDFASFEDFAIRKIS